MHRSRLTFATALTLVIGCLPGCNGNGDSLREIQSRGELKVATRNSPTTYYLDRDGPNGFEYALAGLLAKDLGVELTIEIAFTMDELFEMLERGEVDLAAAGLTRTQQRDSLFPHSSAYNQLRPQVVYVTGSRRPKGVHQLPGRKIVALADTGHLEELRRLQQHELPELEWEEIVDTDATALLERLDAGQAELAIINSNEFEAQRDLHPRLKVAFDLVPDTEQDVVWYLAPEADNTSLQAYIDQFFQRMRDDGTLQQLRKQHSRQNQGFSRKDSHAFNLNVRTVLPKYKKLIQQVADEYQLEWQLLAAVAYQESHWNPQATSPTGVRGMMMLTQPTAREIGVADRLDPLQSLRGGARYLKNLKRRLPKRIQDPDRLWFALAAYNIGLGHLEDARVITQRQGGNPDRWSDVAERLPLLQLSSHYQNTRYGYAAGVEAATYVRNIRQYQKVLNWLDISDNKPLPPLAVEQYLPQMLRGADLRPL